jgi:hypothetical protein
VETEAVLRQQARYCRFLASNNADIRIRAELTRIAEELAARADAVLAVSRPEAGRSQAPKPRRPRR